MYSRHVKEEGHKRDLDFEFISIHDNLKTKTKTKQAEKKNPPMSRDQLFDFSCGPDEEVLQVMPSLHKLICAVHE